MITQMLFLFFASTFASPAETGLPLLLPLNRQYVYSLKSSVSIGTEPRSQEESLWMMEGRLTVQPCYNYTRLRLALDVEKKTVIGNITGNSSGSHYFQELDGDQFLKQPWELDYQDNGFINSIYVGDEPTWAVNLKRAVSVNFQLTRNTGPGSSQTYSMKEPCLDDICVMVYTVNGHTIKKYTTFRYPTTRSSYSWGSVPWTSEYADRMFVDSISTAERIYELEDQKGLVSLELKATYQYKSHDHILAVNTGLTLSYKDDLAPSSIDKLNLTQTTIQYVAGDFSDPTNGIANSTEIYLANKCYTILLKIARKGIDADNIVRNASLIHNMDFIELLNTMSQLKYESLIKVFNELALSTSYDMETARNIFLEIIPHVRSDACARFIKYLVLEEKDKVEDEALLSLIRKLPFNVATHSQHLLEELEVLTKLGLDFPTHIRHAAILSIATLVNKAMEVSQVKQDYFDSIVVRYFRMYSDCPNYADKMVWLLGLCNMGYSAEAYTRIIFADAARDRHERMWAALAGSPHTEEPYMVLETTLPVLTNETEDIQLRIIAVHMFLSSPNVRETDLLFIHNYILGCDSKHLKRFWYSTVKNMQQNPDFTEYRTASYYIPFIAHQVSDPDPVYWATNNYMVCGRGGSGAPSLQLLTVGGSLGAPPPYTQVKLCTGGRRPYKAAIYLIVEGVLANLNEYKEMYNFDPKRLNADNLLEVLKNIKTWHVKAPEKLHVDIVVKIHDKTVFASHLDGTNFKKWNQEDYKYIIDFLRFGSHINQQIVYYPFQTDVHIPTELGTPIRLQSTILSFTSIRGNLTAPSDDDITWKNDLHVRYQGTSVTTLSTAAPLVQTVHIARIQQSLVAHLPMKFNVSLSSADKSLVLTWPNPGDQQAGVAMHSRADVSTESNNDRYDSMLARAEVENKRDSIFFDCEEPMTGTEVLNRLMASNNKNQDFLQSIQPSLIILNGVVLFSSPPAGSCGVILQPKVTASDDVLEVRMHLEDISFVEEVLKAEGWFRLKYYGQGDPENVFLKVEADAKFERKREGNTHYELTLHGHQPNATDPLKKEWRVRLLGNERLNTSFFKDISNQPAAYYGSMSLALTAQQATDSELVVNYTGEPGDGSHERLFVVKASGKNLSKTGFLESDLVSKTTWGQLLKAYSMEPINITVVVKGNNGISSVNINNATQVELKSDSVSWMLDRWTDMQIKKNFGLYRECILYWPYIQTLSGKIDNLPSLQNGTDLMLADCEDNKPRFAVIVVQEGVKIYNGGYNVLLTRTEDRLAVDATNGGEKFLITKEDEKIKISLKLTNIVLYCQSDRTSILVPRLYVNTVCGACAG